MRHFADTTVLKPKDSGTAVPAVTFGMLYLLAMPLSAGLGTVGPLQFAGFNFTGILWVVYLLVGVLILIAGKNPEADNRIYFPPKLWLLWCGYLGLSLFWCEPLQGRNLQDALQISMPLLVGAVASFVVRTEDDLDRLLRVFWPTLFLLCMPLVASRVGLLDAFGLSVSDRSLALTAALAGCVFLAGFPARFMVPLLGWAICGLLIVLTNSRMAALALLLVPALHPLYPSRLLRGAVLLGVAGLAMTLFYLPSFQERFFVDGSGTLTDVFEGKFLTFGRFEVWPDIWEEAWHRPYFGHGIGSAYGYVSSIWENMTQVHNDYLRVGFELGLIGVVIFLSALAWQLWDLRVRIARSQGALRTALAASRLGLLVFMITALTDNTLGYNLWYMNPLFAVLGGAYGVGGRIEAATMATDN